MFESPCLLAVMKTEVSFVDRSAPDGSSACGSNVNEDVESEGSVTQL